MTMVSRSLRDVNFPRPESDDGTFLKAPLKQQPQPALSLFG